MEAFDVEEIGGRRYCVAQSRSTVWWYGGLGLPLLQANRLLLERFWIGSVILFAILLLVAVLLSRHAPPTVFATVQFGEETISDRGVLTIENGLATYEGRSMGFQLGSDDLILMSDLLETRVKIPGSGSIPNQFVNLRGKNVKGLLGQVASQTSSLYPPIRGALHWLPDRASMLRIYALNALGGLLWCGIVAVAGKNITTEGFLVLLAFLLFVTAFIPLAVRAVLTHENNRMEREWQFKSKELKGGRG